MAVDAQAVDLAVQQLSQWLGPAITAVAILVSAAIGGGIASISIASQRKLARQKNSIDVLMVILADRALREGFDALTGIHYDYSKDVKQFAYENQQKSPEAQHIRHVLSFMEYLCVGLNREIYDESTVKEAFHTPLTKIWVMVKPYVDERRRLSGGKTIYQELQQTAERWLAVGPPRKE